MSGDKQITKTFTIMKGRIIGFIIGFSIPFILSRELEVGEYGSYKQIMLIWFVLTHVAHFGMDLGLFYFIKNDQKNGPLHSLNATLFNLGSSICFALAITLGRFEIGSLLNNPELSSLLPWFSLLIITSLPSLHFEYLLMINDLIKKSMILEIFTETSKAIIIIGSILLFHDLKIILISLSALYFFRLTVLIVFNVRRIDKTIHSMAIMKNEFIKQVRYGLPLGAARILLLLVHFDKFIISYIFPIRTFTIYAIGCFDIPLLPALGHTIRDLMSIEMAPLIKKNSIDQALTLWKMTCRRISIIIIPTTIFLFIYGGEIITTIFSTKYSESIPFFKVYILIFMFTIFDSEILFRVFAKNVQLMKVQFFMSAMSIILTVICAITIGPLAALSAKLGTTIVSMVIMLTITSKYFNTPLHNYFPWKESFLIFTVSILLLLPIHYITSSTINIDVISGIIGGVIYLPLLLFILAKLKIITDEEIDLALSKFKKIGSSNGK